MIFSFQFSLFSWTHSRKLNLLVFDPLVHYGCYGERYVLEHSSVVVAMARGKEYSVKPIKEAIEWFNLL